MTSFLRFVGPGLLLGAMALLVAACSEEVGHPHPKAKSQTTCPVMGGQINKEIFADHDGKRVYFCCEGCVETFKKDPAKYIKKLEDAGVVLDQTAACQSG